MRGWERIVDFETLLMRFFPRMEFNGVWRRKCSAARFGTDDRVERLQRMAQYDVVTTVTWMMEGRGSGRMRHETTHGAHMMCGGGVNPVKCTG